MLTIGALLFIGVGCLVMTTVDSVPRNLVVNAIVLGTLSIATGMVFVLDTCLSNRRHDKTSESPKNTRYGDIARTRALDVPDSRAANGVHRNGAHANGVHANGTHANGTHANGNVPKRETAEKKQQNGLLQTTASGNNESVEPTSHYADGEIAVDDDDDDVHRYSNRHRHHHQNQQQRGHKNVDNRGFGGTRHAEWYDTDMDLPKMKKLEVNVQYPDESPDYRRRYVWGSGP